MTVHIEIIYNGNYWCMINNKYWYEYESNYNSDVQFLNNVCKTLLDELKIQNIIPTDNRIIISEEDFIKYVKEHKHTNEECLGHCEDTGAYKWTLDLEINSNKDMISKQYKIGSGDYYGKCEANNKFNKELLPYLSKLNITESDMDKIASLVSDIYDLAYEDGYDYAEHEPFDYI